MKLKRVLQYAHELMENALQEGDIAIDATCGNGHDTSHLCNLVGTKGHVYAFDIQSQAVDNTKKRLKENQVEERATLIQQSHHKIEDHVPYSHLNKLQGAIFNLGYLPGGDKAVITQPDHTIESVTSILHYLQPGGLVVLVVYHGHPGGEEEKTALLELVKGLAQKDYSVLQYGFINQKNNPPFIVAIEKK
ncbi:class I SAM-dependent methyltransferase [Halobacillus sp. A1]|uniref:class I SAM-dependent methyltransferase n=1 Tax=Halobacillus sp. A1 TaxID=2880262 RepID=UPI0020A6B1EA|nr:class I SAM-dependent methyltransferase [Halobacillus sp. A1]MCP3033365.1 class I SAM-dependent methyltransferase [Halobacillus sp. A1]